MKIGLFRRRRSAGPDFKRKMPSKKGIVSCIFALLAVALFIIASTMSANMEGKAAEPVGSLGISSAMLCIIGLVYAHEGVKEREVGYLFPVIGVVLNGLMLVYLLWLYVYGLI